MRVGGMLAPAPATQFVVGSPTFCRHTASSSDPQAPHSFGRLALMNARVTTSAGAVNVVSCLTHCLLYFAQSCAVSAWLSSMKPCLSPGQALAAGSGLWLAGRIATSIAVSKSIRLPLQQQVEIDRRNSSSNNCSLAQLELLTVVGTQMPSQDCMHS